MSGQFSPVVPLLGDWGTGSFFGPIPPEPVPPLRASPIEARATSAVNASGLVGRSRTSQSRLSLQSEPTSLLVTDKYFDDVSLTHIAVRSIVIVKHLM